MTNYRAAIIDASGVVNSVVVLSDDSPWEPPMGFTTRPLTEDESVAPGWRRDGETWVAPSEAEPEPDLSPTLEEQLVAQQEMIDLLIIDNMMTQMDQQTQIDELILFMLG